MKIAISGTYSTGKTTTTLALAYYTGLLSTHAKTMREILPKALPGKRLEDATGPELVQLGFRRLMERAVRESHLEDFVSDGSSLHEWVYGMVRTELGMNPNEETDKGNIVLTEDLKYLKEIMINFGAVAKDYAKDTYESFVHLPVEFPLVADGHRPVSELFRRRSNDLLLETIQKLDIPYYVVGGTIAERLEKITEIYHLEPVMSVEEAIRLAKKEAEKFDIVQEGRENDN
ncbi:AAA family ATPase [Leuconostoc gasicomitatum]|uniref:AAA family ATPase n=1 Tax=Leuconostoc gasicomitatum TaxID=115778 RepID=A0A9Q3XSX1_9LACO|nr:AAA family ATPase [Leuconostoc gasicomitatum]MBZ5962324.1 AAA family ATPase [Leuconostoc gasicomitatum]MBZ5984406.1 AAA family ATPase [Leuconostoc gasicomitatum]